MERLDQLLARMPMPAAAPPVDLPANPLPPSCPTCHGAGYLRMDAPVGHPDFGRILPCTCRQAELVAARYSLLPGDAMAALRDQTFACFDPTVPGTEAAFQVCQTYAEDPAGWLVLLGSYGCGKTHLAAAVAHRVREQGIPIYFAGTPISWIIYGPPMPRLARCPMTQPSSRYAACRC